MIPASNTVYDNLYGISLDEYVARHGLTLENLITKVRMDLDILKENQRKVHEMDLPYPESYLNTEIWQAIRKKDDHLEHLLDWAAEGKYRD